jgi:hypothetical protein
MSNLTRALLLAAGSFLFFGALIVLLFVVLDVKLSLVIAPLAVLAFSSFGVYRAARDEPG